MFLSLVSLIVWLVADVHIIFICDNFLPNCIQATLYKSLTSDSGYFQRSNSVLQSHDPEVGIPWVLVDCSGPSFKDLQQSLQPHPFTITVWLFDGFTLFWVTTPEPLRVFCVVFWNINLSIGGRTVYSYHIDCEVLMWVERQRWGW